MIATPTPRPATRHHITLARRLVIWRVIALCCGSAFFGALAMEGVELAIRLALD